MTPVTPERIRDLHKKSKNDKSIPWGYSPDCCYARAHVMAGKATADGIDAKKICIKPVPPATRLYPKDDAGNPINGPDGNPIAWTYHVAIVVTQLNADGTTTDMVVDPALFPGPVPVDEWVKRVSGGAPGNMSYYDLNIYFPGMPTGFDADADARKAFRGHWRTLRRLSPVIGPPLPPPSGHGIIRNVSHVSLIKGNPGRVRVSPGNWLNVYFEGQSAREDIEVIVEIGVIENDPVAIWQGATDTVLLAVPALRGIVVSSEVTASGLALMTSSPRPLGINLQHPQFVRLANRAELAIQQKRPVYIAAAPASEEIDDLVFADKWDATFKG